jgi:hypothetical protein
MLFADHIKFGLQIKTLLIAIYFVFFLQFHPLEFYLI